MSFQLSGQTSSSFSSSTTPSSSPSSSTSSSSSSIFPSFLFWLWFYKQGLFSILPGIWEASRQQETHCHGVLQVVRCSGRLFSSFYDSENSWALIDYVSVFSHKGENLEEQSDTPLPETEVLEKRLLRTAFLLLAGHVPTWIYGWMLRELVFH